ADLKLVKLGCDSFVLFRRERMLDHIKEDMVFLPDMVSKQVAQPGSKFGELRSLFCAQGILEAFNKRALLIVLKQHLPQRRLGRGRGAHQLRKQSALFFGLMKVIAKFPEKAQECLDIL